MFRVANDPKKTTITSREARCVDSFNIVTHHDKELQEEARGREKSYVAEGTRTEAHHDSVET